jgi:Asp/Glu/hydantoin racemase
MALYQKELRERLEIPIFLSSLLQIPFIGEIIPYGRKIGIITANARSLTEDVIRMCGIEDVDNLEIAGLEDEPNFSSAFLLEEGFVDTEKVEREVVDKALKLQKDNPDIGAILLECSVLPPYAEAVQRATGLPVFDFVTMIRHVFSAVVRESGGGFM